MALEGRKVIALVPARIGSKGIPKKNLALLGGRPLMYYTVRAATGSKFIDCAFVSSDDSQILELAEALGAQSLRRPGELAGDHATAAQVVNHYIEAVHDKKPEGDPLLVYLQPTSPFRSSAHIDEALIGMLTAGASSLVSVEGLVKSPYKSFKLDSHGRLEALFDERLTNFRRQDLPRCYIPNGAIYVFGLSEFRKKGGFPSNGSWPYVMEKADSVDIDTQTDLELAEKLLRERCGRF